MSDEEQKSGPASSAGPAVTQPSGASQGAAAPGAAAGGGDGQPRSIGLAMLALILGVFMAILDTSIVNVALPKMMSVYGVSQSDIEWVVTAYSLVSGALVPATGYMGDRFGYKRMYLISLIIFTIGSGLCGIAWSNDTMILFRIIQAVGGGALMPISMAMLFRMIPQERRGMAMGLFGIAIMFAPATGPTLSGYIVEYLDWRLIFTLNVPIGVIDLFLAMAALKEIKAGIQKKFDLWGFLTSSIGLSTLLYGVGRVSEKGWTDIEVIGFIAFGLLCLILFVMIELSVKDPLLDLSLLANFTYTLSLVISSLVTVIMMGMLFLIPIFLQNVSGLSAVQTGLLLLPQAIVSGIMMPIAGALFDKIGARPLAVAGLLITAVSLYLTTNLTMETSNGTLVFWLCLRAVGMGLMMMPIQTAGMNMVPMHKMGQGTALSNTIRQISGAFGIAWLGLMFSDRAKFHVASLSDQLSAYSVSVMDNFNRIVSKYLSFGQSPAQAQSSAMSEVAGQIQLHSTVLGMDDVFYISTLLAIFTMILSLFLSGTKKKSGDGPQAHMMGE